MRVTVCVCFSFTYYTIMCRVVVKITGGDIMGDENAAEKVVVVIQNNVEMLPVTVHTVSAGKYICIQNHNAQHTSRLLVASRHIGTACVKADYLTTIILRQRFGRLWAKLMFI